MLIGDIRPSTIEGIKSLAAQYRRQQGIKHSIALDLAAKAASCSNFKHAQRTLPMGGSALEPSYVLLTIYWCDRDKRFQIGRETLRISLTRPILKTCSKYDLKHVRGFGNLRMVAPDHFICDSIAASQCYARNRLTTAARSLKFMEQTGLRPSRDHRKRYPNGQLNDKLPGNDHTTDWVDPSTGQFILIDEPYRNAPDEDERAAWAERTGWRVVKTSWPGMYFPGRCDLHVATDCSRGYDIDALVAAINEMPAPILAKDWAGESSSSWDTFLSPMAKSKQDTRRARCRGMVYPEATKSTLPYSYSMGERRRRPAASMPVNDHIAIGSMIKAIIRSNQRPYGVYRRLDSLRSTLEDWMAIEIGRDQMQGPEFFEIYYQGTEGDLVNSKRAMSHNGIIDMLCELKLKLQGAYPDCAPLRLQLHKIDMSVSLVSRMKIAKD